MIFLILIAWTSVPLNLWLIARNRFLYLDRESWIRRYENLEDLTKAKAAREELKQKPSIPFDEVKKAKNAYDFENGHSA